MINEPIWLSIFRSLRGLEEIPGSRSNPVILNWVKDLGAPSWYDNDDKAWCALAMNRVLLASQLPPSGTGFELLRANSFEKYGTQMTIPALGCIMVFKRLEGHHVGLYLGERKDSYCILGANQSNTVGIAWIQKARLVATRWPVCNLTPVVERVWLNAVNTVSENEA